jgi:NAD(P)-dependent dehydrogenase (short-subunit alcohol dehydrogenase family)
MDPSSILLTDKVVIVTGAARGIGRATAELCTKFGATVATCDREAQDVNAALSALFDVRDADARDVFVEGVVNKFGGVDVLVNNAGGTFFSPFLEVSEKGEAAMIAENFGHITALIRSVVPFMPTDGVIINLTSIEAHQAAPGFAIYGAMKAALEHLTRTLALELAPLGIRVNAIAPDAIPTGGDLDVRAEMLAGSAIYDPAVLPPLGFMGDPEDAAAVALFLASDMARFVTGTTVHVDGGNWAAGGWRRFEEDQD